MALHEAGVIVIDGRSGSGKSQLAQQLVARLTRERGHAQLLQLEDLYPGWEGLHSGSAAVVSTLDTLGYRRYDWHTGGFAERIELELSVPLVIEGCGAVTRVNLSAAVRFAQRVNEARGKQRDDHARAVHSIWLECAPEVRQARALARDGDMFRPHWEAWAAQEDVHYAVAKPASLVDEIIIASPDQTVADIAHTAWNTQTAR